MVEVLYNSHFVKVGSMKNYVFEFLSVGHILIICENMLLILCFETFNQITMQNWWECIHLLEYNEKQMFGAHATYSVTHLLFVNVISSQ